tara:strand:+ start:42172 stop:42600 length:429 start_codon:yes stop_codon:yes gene_type:complete
MIECKLMALVKSRLVNNNPSYKKFGHYMSSFYSIKGYGRTCWVVVANILVDYDYYIEKGKDSEDVALECIEFLNHRPKSKYGKKRKRKSLYGTFRPKPYLVKFFNKDGVKFIQVLLITEDRTNPNFWGEGNKGEFSCRRKRK